MSLVQSISETFSNIENVGEGIFRAEKLSNDRAYQVHFFDETKSFLNDDFDLDGYQEKYILSDYYSNEKSLQWNFYLHFIADGKDLFSDKGREISKKITENTRLTRKTVSTVDELIDRMKSTDFSDVDVVDAKNIWAEILGDQYQEILDVNQARTVVIDNISNESSNVRKSPRKKLSNVPPYKMIKAISIGSDFRTHSTGKEYLLSDVNLIKGVNAAGKTSLLEAIELCVCGKTFRNDSPHSNFCFDIEFIDGSREKVVRSEDTTYINRAYSWYGQTLKSNSLPDLFSRYNFYNADAAANFSTSAKAQSLSEALSGVIFGADAGEIYNRILSFQGDLSKEISSKKTRINDINFNIRQKELDIKNRESIDSKENSIDSVSESLLGLGFISRLEKAKDVEKFIDVLNRIENICIRWKVVSNNTNVTDYKNLLSLKEKLKLSVQNLLEIDDHLGSFRGNITKLNQELANITPKLAIADRLIEYYDFGANELIHNQKELIELEGEISKSNKVVSRIHEFEGLPADKYKDVVVGDTLEELRDRLTQHEEKYARTSAVINSLKNEMDKSLSLINDLVHLGREFVKIIPDTDVCPLCRTDVRPDKLSERIESPIDRLNDKSANLDSLLTTLNTTKAQIDEVNYDISKLNSLELCANILFENPLSVDIGKIINTCHEIKGKQEENIKSKDLLDHQISTNAAKGFTADELSKIVDSLNFDIETNTIENASSLLNSLKSDCERLKNQISKLTEEGERLKTQKSKIIQSHKLAPDTSVSYIRSVIEEIDDLQKNIESLTGVIAVEKIDLPDSLLFKIESAKKISISFLEKRSNDEAIELLKKSISRERESLGKINIQVSRLYPALEKVNTIVEKNSLNDLVNKHLKENIDQIQSIFKKIHTPNEFDKIELIDSKLILSRRGTGEPCDSNMMSTGQRSALALSVFMSMNMSLKNGPPFLIFDDPITYIDDLNILSFLDYLQTVALKGDRQILFATASNKISTLLQKKMDFMQERFNMISLNR